MHLLELAAALLFFGIARTLHSGDDGGAWVSFLESAAASGYLLCSDWIPMSVNFNTSHGATMQSSIDCRERANPDAEEKRSTGSGRLVSVECCG